MIGQRFGRLTVIAEAPRKPTSRHLRRWVCSCDCGGSTVSFTHTLKRGRAKSCGCLRIEKLVSVNRLDDKPAHNMSKSATYRTWCSIKQRCLNPNNSRWMSYGGAGITICDRWRDSFDAFYEDMGDRPSRDHSIDRIDNGKGYSPDNCRWATRSEQQINSGKKGQIYVQIGGRKMTVRQIADAAGIGRGAVLLRLSKGLTGEALLAPNHAGSRHSP